jgi:MinD superfamily P-loop ATPase
VCEFKAIVVIVDKVLVFDELCHGCGACSYICPVDAITEIEKPIGVIRKGPAKNRIHFLQGLLNIGEPMATPIIRRLKKETLPNAKITLRDAPPGTSCPVIEAIEGSDFTILVTEPTPFGLNDLKLAVGVGRELNIPMGVIINRADAGDNSVHEYCKNEKLPILLEIPLMREIAEGYAGGKALIETLPEYRDRFLEVFEKIQREVHHGGK